ncbi:MAG: glycosyltransferase family 4 protein [Microcystaceae cyanobacterium]
MLKLYVDVTPIRGQLSGVGYYVYSLIQGLANLQQSEGFQLGLYFHPSLKNWLTQNVSPSPLLQNYYPIETIPIPVTLVNLLSQFPNPLLSYLEDSLNHPDIIQGTDHFIYPFKQGLRVMTIHDLTCFKYPNYATNIVKSYQSRITNCLKWTDLIITFADSTKQDIIKYLDFREDKIRVTPQASRYSPAMVYSPPIKPNLYNFNEPYILFVSTLEPRKNIITLIEAFNYLKKIKKIEHNLVLVGKLGWKYQPILDKIAQSSYQQFIHHLDYLSDEAVAYFYQNAEVFVYPSYYEGFGLPILEAMTLGTPVITSNVSSLPEVAGDAAILVNPNKMLDLADAILEVINNSSLRDQLIDKGKKRSQHFSWQQTAQKTLEAYL